jgi:hypothetical protein
MSKGLVKHVLLMLALLPVVWVGLELLGFRGPFREVLAGAILVWPESYFGHKWLKRLKNKT